MRDKQLHTSRFRIAGRALAMPRACLFEDRLRLRGWTTAGQFEEVIRLADVVDVEWFTSVKHEPNIRIVTARGGERHLWLPNAGLWCYEIRRLAGIRERIAEIPSAARLPVADAA